MTIGHNDTDTMESATEAQWRGIKGLIDKFMEDLAEEFKKNEGLLEELLKEQTYDLVSIYDEKIAPLALQIFELCKEYKIPMLMAFSLFNDEKGNMIRMSYQNERCNPLLAEASELLRTKNNADSEDEE